MEKDHGSTLTEPDNEKMNGTSKTSSNAAKAGLFIGIILLAYVTSLDSMTSSTYQAQAAADFQEHSMSATINIIRSVTMAVAQPPIAKVADVFGRLEAYCLCIFTYVAGIELTLIFMSLIHKGCLILAFSPSIYLFAVRHHFVPPHHSHHKGAIILYVLGITGMNLLQEVLVAGIHCHLVSVTTSHTDVDTTSLRNRVLFSILPSCPFLINTWVSGYVVSLFSHHLNWRYGIGVYSIAVPLFSLPIVLFLFLRQRKNKRRNGHTTKEGEEKERSSQVTHLDVLGTLTLILSLSLFVVPLTLVGQKSFSWKSPIILGLLVGGFFFLLFFVSWELRYALHPALPLKLLRDRSVSGGCVVGFLSFFSFTLMMDYFYTYIVVAVGASTETATRAGNIFNFSSVIVCLLVGVAVRHVRRLKPFQVIGALFITSAYTLMVWSRTNLLYICLCQLALGIGSGCLSMTTQSNVQASTSQADVAAITAMSLTLTFLGGAVGAAVGGTIWSTFIPIKLVEHLPADYEAQAGTIYSDPFTWCRDHGMETIERQAVVLAYTDVMRVMIIVAASASIPLLLAVLLMKNPKLTDERNLRKMGEVTERERNEEMTRAGEWGDVTPGGRGFVVDGMWSNRKSL
ncbi:siderophore iron transporter mirC [Planoprotostelium fungivorum]|uniref:Siderophore iron transporter mirC n=1 Tax=Planoprotostelium fungivorum TaxID=1890364 RepID=A0A2P6N0J7_9EUKA|nr:siderophore iron transporter mirC [Planoprotostelium fungivorum]